MTDLAHVDICLRKIAWHSWSAEGAAVPLDAIDDSMAVETAIDSGILLRDEAGVRFLNPSVMVAAAAQYVLEHEGATLTASPRASFERLDQLWTKGIGKENAEPAQYHFL